MKYRTGRAIYLPLLAVLYTTHTAEGLLLLLLCEGFVPVCSSIYCQSSPSSGSSSWTRRNDEL